MSVNIYIYIAEIISIKILRSILKFMIGKFLKYFCVYNSEK